MNKILKKKKHNSYQMFKRNEQPFFLKKDNKIIRIFEKY